ncbi:MAG TPA: sigma 54-interacting transcriptional regulator [Ignavibacteria bacterium]|nr:sigma 54-interacting transcriptional regulator [Ignavibacteria bacterium]
MDITKIKKLGDLKKSGYKIKQVKDEIRDNLIKRIENNEILFDNIIGYENTVIPMIQNSLLAKHDLLLLGLRGQAKTKIARMLPELLDEYIPIVKGSEINDNPFQPISKYSKDLIAEYGDETEIEWISREQRYSEKLATPDVNIADLIGDIDPIKAANRRIHYSHEGAIHYGLIPRTNRGIFVINELPDLQPRIQVGLLNIMQEKDIQIRGFNIRIPLDLLIVFTANPEDYTNRGNIITPLKDRIDSQITTHYPKILDDGIKITESQSWTKRNQKININVPYYFKEIIEMVAFQARVSEFVDQKSGVSARLTISSLENLISNAERRAIQNKEDNTNVRITDLYSIIPGITGKIELVFEGEQEGAVKVAKALIAKSVREIFKKYFPDPLERKKKNDKEVKSVYFDIVEWFQDGSKINISDNMKFKDYINELKKVKGLEEFVKKYPQYYETEKELASLMEFVLDGLHQNSKIAKDEMGSGSSYKDMLPAIFSGKDYGLEGLDEEYYR